MPEESDLVTAMRSFLEEHPNLASFEDKWSSMRFLADVRTGLLLPKNYASHLAGFYETQIYKPAISEYMRLHEK
jgi:hypothetical protein